MTGEVSVGVGGWEVMWRVVVMIVMSPLLDAGRVRVVGREVVSDMLEVGEEEEMVVEGEGLIGGCWKESVVTSAEPC